MFKHLRLPKNWKLLFILSLLIRQLAHIVLYVLLLKVLGKYIAQPLQIIVNYSLGNGIFPDKLKAAKVNRLHKKNSSDSPSNYRPISILSVFSKIFEKLMHTRLCKFLDAYEILYPLQFSFAKSIQLFMPFYFQLNLLSFLLTKESLDVEFLLICKKPLIQLIIRFYLMNSNIMVSEAMF